MPNISPTAGSDLLDDLDRDLPDVFLRMLYDTLYVRDTSGKRGEITGARKNPPGRKYNPRSYSNIDIKRGLYSIVCVFCI